MGKNHERVCRKRGIEVSNIYDPQTSEISYESFLKNIKYSDGVIISSPTSSHKKNLEDILSYNKNIKVLLEKPCFENSDYSNSSIINSKNILIGQVERFNPVVEKIKKLLEGQKIFQIRTKRVSNVSAREKIDCRKDIGIHDLDFCSFILNKKTDKIEVRSTSKNYHEVLFYNIDETIIINEVSWEYPYKDRTFNILTENGEYKGHFFNQTLAHIDWTGKENTIDVEKVEPLDKQIVFFLKMITENIASKNTINENLNLLKLLGYWHEKSIYYKLF